MDNYYTEPNKIMQNISTPIWVMGAKMSMNEDNNLQCTTEHINTSNEIKYP